MIRSLNGLDYKTKSKLGFERRREIIHGGMRNIALFDSSGEVRSIDNLQSRMRLGEYDITERYKADEFRVALTDLREVSPSEVQKVIRRFAGTSEFSKLKCLLLRVQSQEHLKKETVRSTENILQMMEAGEVRVLSI